LGVNLRVLIPKTKIDFKNLSGKIVAIDAYNSLYQFLSSIRQPDGTPLKNRSGLITSHLTGLLYRTVNLVENGVKVVYVFDGKSPDLKDVEVNRRKAVKEKALVKYKQAKQDGDLKLARRYAQMTSKLKTYMVDDSKRLLTELGIPWIQAPSEGEAQAAYMTQKGTADYCGSQDYDSLLFGATYLVRNVTVSRRRRIPKRNTYVEVFPEVMKLDAVLKELQINREQLVDLAILMGTDFNPGVKGVGPKTALKLIKKHGCIEEVIPTLENPECVADYKEIQDVFLNPDVTDDYHLKWNAPNAKGVVEFLCRDRDFSEDRVRNAVNKMALSLKESKSKTTLESWFG